MNREKLNVEALYTALDSQRKSFGKSWREVSRELEISPSTFTRMSQGRSPDLDALRKCARWLGEPIESFLEGGNTEEARDPDTVKQIYSFLRADRNLSPKDAEAIKDIVESAYKMVLRLKEKHENEVKSGERVQNKGGETGG